VFLGRGEVAGFGEYQFGAWILIMINGSVLVKFWDFPSENWFLELVVECLWIGIDHSFIYCVGLKARVQLVITNYYYYYNLTQLLSIPLLKCLLDQKI
jgi:hypothetical protein